MWYSVEKDNRGECHDRYATLHRCKKHHTVEAEQLFVTGKHLTHTGCDADDILDFIDEEDGNGCA